ncbi:hypothetical protein [Micromonospora orduensis]|uniref:hypothetical protein n=1 Tax=Micromonospora orduensis TaxID=1420891 RepID=UPI00142F1C60|nr:hypothetical protein [Micromonospora orduensis]
MLLNPRRHSRELRSQVDAVSVSKNQDRPETVSQLMTEPLTSVSDLTAPVDSHHELRKIPNVTDKPQRKIAGAPRPTTHRNVVTVIQLSDRNRSQPQALKIHNRNLQRQLHLIPFIRTYLDPSTRTPAATDGDARHNRGGSPVTMAQVGPA